MKKFYILFFVFSFLAPLASNVQAQNDLPTEDEAMALAPQVEYYRATVKEIKDEGLEKVDSISAPQLYQQTVVELNEGSDKGQTIEIKFGGEYTITANQLVHVGERVVVAKTAGINGTSYYITDKYRLNSLIWVGVLFALLVLLFSGWRGLASMLGLVASLFILVKFIIPNIIGGQNPLAVAAAGVIMIAVVSLYLAHGVNRRTTIALVSTLITLGLAMALSVWFVSLAKLSGAGSEEAIYAQTGIAGIINLKGLLLAGIIIGVLGVLDDITTSQAAVVDELLKANPQLGVGELYRRALSVGREHIASLVNTLVLAYAGASLPLFLLFTANKEYGFWVIANGEFLAEEIIRTLVGSSTLVLAVPITTILAAYWLHRHGRSGNAKSYGHVR